MLVGVGWMVGVGGFCAGEGWVVVGRRVVVLGDGVFGE